MKKLLFCTLMTVLVLHLASSLVLSEDTDFRKGSEAGVCFMTGGVSKGERADMEKQSHDYNLKIVVAAASGAYLAEIPVMICDTNEKQVFQGKTDGPWLYVRLPDGTYTIKATHEGQKKEKKAQVDEGLEVIMFHWPT